MTSTTSPHTLQLTIQYFPDTSTAALKTSDGTVIITATEPHTLYAALDRLSRGQPPTRTPQRSTDPLAATQAHASARESALGALPGTVRPRRFDSRRKRKDSAEVLADL